LTNLESLAGLLVVTSGVFLIGLALLVVGKRTLAGQFLRSFASSWP